MRLIDADALTKRICDDTSLHYRDTRMLLRYIAQEKTVKEIVHCKDCTHRPHLENENGSDYGFNVRGDEICPCVNNDDGWYSWMPKDNFYCGFGERKGGDTE